MTAPPVTFADIKARMRAVSEQFDKSIERKAKGPEFINFNKPGKYVVRALPSRNYPDDVRWFRKLDRHFIINVVTPDKQNVVQTAKVPQTFIKFLRTFQDMVNQLFCDPTHGNLIAFEAFRPPTASATSTRSCSQHPMPTGFSGEQIPDLDELLKAAIDDMQAGVSAFTGNLAAPLAATGQASCGFTATTQPLPPFAAALACSCCPLPPLRHLRHVRAGCPAGPVAPGPLLDGMFAAAHADFSCPGISDAEARPVASAKPICSRWPPGYKARDKTKALRPVRP